MKKILSLFGCSLLEFLCVLLILWIREGAIVLILMLSKSYILPVFHFSALNTYYKNNKKLLPVIISTVLFLCTVVAGMLLLYPTSRSLTLFIAAALGWSVLCGITITAHNFLCCNKKPTRFLIVLCVEAIVALLFNATFTRLVTPLLKHIDAVEIVLLFVSAFALAVVSFVLGRNASRINFPFLTMIWGFCVLVSQLAAFELSGITIISAGIIPFTIGLWLVTAFVIFGCFLIGKFSNKNGSLDPIAK